MSGVMYVLQEEQKRLEDLVAVYRKKISELASGRIVLRGRGRAYAYHVYSEQGKEHQVYLGRSTSQDAAKLREEVRRRRVFEQRIRDARAEAKLIGKMLRVR